MCPEREPGEGAILVDRLCSLPLKTARVSPTQNRNIWGSLTVNRRIQSVDRVSDQQNTLSPHGQRAYLEEAGVHPLDKTSKFIRILRRKNHECFSPGGRT